MDDGTVAQSVHLFWFGEPPESADGGALERRWFRSDAQFDAEIRGRFGEYVEQAMHGTLDHWAGSARGRLALIILLDQFTRNIFRGTRNAFDGDARALELSMQGIEAGMERSLTPLERVFFCMPLQHAESLDVQEAAVRTFDDIASAECAPDVRDELDSFADYARRHRDIIARFGRFPHRNAVLGRKSTPDEIEFLRSGGPSFGQ